MSDRVNNLENISKHLFWDINTDLSDKEKNKTIIIERVINRGDINDVKIIISEYGLDTIKQEIVNAGFLDKKTLNWVSLFLNIPKTKFRCYKKTQSKQVHWNF